MFVTALILFNTILMAMYWYNEPVELSEFRENANYFLVIIFTLELILKLVGFGPRRFFKDGFNIFDTFIVVVSLADLTLKFIETVNHEKFIIMQFSKALRAVRMLKLARYHSGMQKILH